MDHSFLEKRLGTDMAQLAFEFEGVAEKVATKNTQVVLNKMETMETKILQSVAKEGDKMAFILKYHPMGGSNLKQLKAVKKKRVEYLVTKHYEQICAKGIEHKRKIKLLLTNIVNNKLKAMYNVDQLTDLPLLQIENILNWIGGYTPHAEDVATIERRYNKWLHAIESAGNQNGHNH